MNHSKIWLAAFLVVVIVVSFFVASNLLAPAKQPGASKPFYVGIETGWNANAAQCEATIDQVKNYTNMYIIASPQVIKNETALNEVCDYAYAAGMYFMPEFYQQFFVNPTGYTPHDWFVAAKERYGSRLLGVYYYDEPGGNQLDTTEIVKGNPYITPASPAQSYLDYSNYFSWLWTHGSDGGLNVTSDFFRSENSSLFTSDYGLYWFDYGLGYNTILAQFGWNNSRQMQISLVRGAAKVQDQSWGAIVTWTYNGTMNGGTYLEPAPQIYSDMVLAYDSGASYVSIYDSTQNYINTTLSPDDYQALSNFWTYVQHNPSKHGSLKADTAVVLPQNYAFGFRSPTDSVWQYHMATSWTQKMYTDITDLLNQKGSKIDIVYSDPQFQQTIKKAYGNVQNWPVDFEKGVSYPVTDLNDSLGYSTIQDALSSFATYQGATVHVNAGTYQEGVTVSKPVVLEGEGGNKTTIQANGYGALEVLADNVTVSGFTLKNEAIVMSRVPGTGLQLQDAHGCLITNNLIANNYYGVVLVNSTANIFRNNIINTNSYSLVFQNSSPNDIDASNIVNGQPYMG